MASSAENSSGVHWCKVWEALVQSQVRFNRVPENFPENARQPWCKAKSGSRGFRRRFRRRFWRRSGRFWCRARSGPTRLRRRFPRRSGRFGAQSGESSGENLGRFGAEAGQFQRGSEEEVWEALVRTQAKFNWEAFVQSQVKFNKVPKKVRKKVQRRSGRLWCREGPAKVPGNFGAQPREVHLGSGEGSGKVPGRGFGAEPGQVQQDSGEGSGEGLGGFGADPAEVFPALGRARKICENKTLRLLGIPPKLISNAMEH